MSHAPITTLLLTTLARQLALPAAVHPAASGVPPEARRLLACQADVGRAARRLLVRRDLAIVRCLDLALRCPGALAGTPTSANDACLAAAAAGCAAALARAGTAERHVEDMGPRCTVAGRTSISPQAFLGDDGLALERDAPFCPDLGTASPADASRCQSLALACQVDAAVRASVPRAAELLGRIGIALDEDGRCLGSPACGNGEIDGDEECDDGADNSDVLPDHCRTDCTEPRCGDGVVDSDEECDDGNQTDGDGCAADCTVEPGVCGNGVVDDDEECDDGVANSDVLPDHCRTDCTAPSCGDGVVDPAHGETCEPPATLLCTADCRSRLPFPPGPLRARAGGPDDLARCQQGIAGEAARFFRDSRRLVERCVMGATRCVVGGGDACLARASARCVAAATRRDTLRARAVPRLGSACGALSVDRLLGALAFADTASACPLPGSGPPTPADLLGCVLDQIQCVAQKSVALTVPRAYEFLSTLDLDPDAVYPCVPDLGDE